MQGINTLLATILCISALYAHGQEAAVNITPRPEFVNIGEGSFILNIHSVIKTEGAGLEKPASFLSDYLSRFYGFYSKKNDSTGLKKVPAGVLRLAISPSALSSSAYTLHVSKKGIDIVANSDTGIFYGIQSLIQLLPLSKENATSDSLIIPAVEVRDSPRFNYRGIHLDVARHFYSIKYLEKFIDLLALHKFNRFHWHLTDDQGWRMEIKKYPLLTSVGSCRDQTLKGRFGSDLYDSTRYCGFYTQDEISKLVSYAAARYITIVPEIDMPGHTTAALTSYPFLGCTKGPYEVSQTWGVHKEVMCAGNDSTYIFINGVLREVTEFFPSSIIHIGGDEVPKDRWKACLVCQSRMRKEGLKNESELQSYFINRVNGMVKAYGRTMAGWDEILEGKDVPGTVIMNWRGSRFAESAMRLGHPVIFTPEAPLYLNFQQSANEDSLTQGGNNSLEKVYAYDPDTGNTSSSKLILGIQANLWTEYISNPAKLEYMALPRLSAVSEAAWSSTLVKDFGHFEKRLPALISLYKMWGFNFSSAHFGLQHETVYLNGGGLGWKLFSRTPGKIFYREEGSSTEHLYSSVIPVQKTTSMFARMENTLGQAIGQPVTVHLNVNEATGKKVVLTDPPNSMYSGKGPLSLVDGIQNKQGMVKGGEFLGFIGVDLEATIDLGSLTGIGTVTLHAFEQQASWIYAPRSVAVWISKDGKKFQQISNQAIRAGKKNLTYRVPVNKKARFVRLKAVNHGIISEGRPEPAEKAGFLPMRSQ